MDDDQWVTWGIIACFVLSNVFGIANAVLTVLGPAEGSAYPDYYMYEGAIPEDDCPYRGDC